MRTTLRVATNLTTTGPTGFSIPTPTSCDINHMVVRQVSGEVGDFTVKLYSTADALPGSSSVATVPDPACFRIHPPIVAEVVASGREAGAYVAELNLASSSGYIPYRDYDAGIQAVSGHLYMVIIPATTDECVFDAVFTLTTGRLGS